ncbi:MAG: polysaccharide biosynthesis protein [Clostridium sp.]|nr:polysaccharide biosynthesis protein [Clostridium sp.]
MNNKLLNSNVIKGSIILGIASLLSKFIGVLYRVPITAILGDEGVAIYANAYQIYILILTISAIGIPAGISKLISECMALKAYKDVKKIYRTTLIYIGGLSFFLSIGLWIMSDFIASKMLGISGLGLTLKVLSPTIFITSILAVIRGYFQGLNTMYPTALSQVVEQIFNAIFSITFASYFVQFSISSGAAGSALGTGVGALSGLIVILIISSLSRKSINQKMLDTRVDLHYNTNKILKRIFITVVPMVMISVIFSLITVFDSYILLKELPASVNYLKNLNLTTYIPIENALSLDTTSIVASLSGQYLNKYIPIINIPVSLILVISTSSIPSISAAAAQNYQEVTVKAEMLLKTSLLWAFPAAIGLTIFAQPIIHLLYPSTPGGGELLMHGSIVIIFITISQITTSILQGIGKQLIPTINVIMACAVKIILNVFLLKIPLLTIYPLVYSTTICYIIFSILNLFALKKLLNLRVKWGKLLFTPLISSLTMGILGYSLFSFIKLLAINNNIALIISIIFSVLIYIPIVKIINTIFKKFIV